MGCCAHRIATGSGYRHRQLLNTNECESLMSAKISLVGQVFGRLKVIADAAPSLHGSRRNECLCQCGNTKIVQSAHLRAGLTRSCGCLRREVTRARSLTHGHAVNRKASATLVTWRHMIERCGDSSVPKFKNYGGRGITVCERWMKFENFLEDMGEAPATLSLDRFPNNDGNYEKSNCRWGTRRQQARNKRNNKILTVNGVTACLAELYEIFGITDLILQKRIWRRLKDNWTPERAFFGKKQKNHFT